MAADSSIVHVLVGEPVSTSPEHALVYATRRTEAPPRDLSKTGSRYRASWQRGTTLGSSRGHSLRRRRSPADAGSPKSEFGRQVSVDLEADADLDQHWGIPDHGSSPLHCSTVKTLGRIRVAAQARECHSKRHSLSVAASGTWVALFVGLIPRGASASPEFVSGRGRRLAGSALQRARCLGDVRRDRVHQRRRQAVVGLELSSLSRARTAPIWSGCAPDSMIEETNAANSGADQPGPWTARCG